MKGRWLTLFIGLLLGAGIGYFASQKAELKKAIPLLKNAGAVMTDEGVRLYRQAKGLTNATPSGAPIPKAEPPKVEAGPDKSAYIRDALQLNDIKTTQEKAPNEGINVSGRVRNLGVNSLSRIVLDVFFLGGEGMMEEKRVEVLLGTSLPPWQERVFSVRIPNLNGEWSSSRASVVEIAF